MGGPALSVWMKSTYFVDDDDDDDDDDDGGDGEAQRDLLFEMEAAQQKGNLL